MIQQLGDNSTAKTKVIKRKETTNYPQTWWGGTRIMDASATTRTWQAQIRGNLTVFLERLVEENPGVTFLTPQQVLGFGLDLAAAVNAYGRAVQICNMCVVAPQVFLWGVVW
jgi:hypothetical protein